MGCHQLPEAAHGKEGVDGSSPSEGLKRPLLASVTVIRRRERRRTEEPLLGSELGWPVDAVSLCEAEVGAKRLAHPLDEPLGPARLEAVFRQPAGPRTCTVPSAASMRGQDPAERARSRNPARVGRHVPAPAALVWRHVELRCSRSRPGSRVACGPRRGRRGGRGTRRTPGAAPAAPEAARHRRGRRTACRSHPRPRPDISFSSSTELVPPSALPPGNVREPHSDRESSGGPFRILPRFARLRSTQPSRRPLHGKEGVDGSSPSEGSAKYLQVAPFLLAARDQRRACR